jgi:hypothetical protein
LTRWNPFASPIAAQANYKTMFFQEPEPLIDSFVPLTPRLAAHGFGAAYGAKKLIKETPALWDAVSRARKLRGRATSEL